MAKPRVIKDYEKLPEEVIDQIKIAYPTGYAEHLITISNIDGKMIEALPFEAEDKYYLIRMTVAKAEALIEDDDDFDDDGNLISKVKKVFDEEYDEEEATSDFVQEISIDEMDEEDYDIADESTDSY